MSFWKNLFGKKLKAKTETRISETAVETSSQPVAVSVAATPFETAPSKTFTKLINPGWELTGSFTMWEVAEFIRTHQKDWPDHRLFGVLEDIDQAFYTSGHSLMANDLDEIDPETQDGLHPSSFESLAPGEPEEFYGLSHPSEFPIRHRMFMEFVSDKDPKSWQGRLSWSEGGEACPSLLCGNPARPDMEGWGWPRDKRSFVMQVPVPQACEAVSAFVNGYFNSDLQPHENYFLAKALEDKFGLKLFGFGASYAGYMRETPLSDKDAKALAVFLAPLYSAMPDNNLVGRIETIAAGQHTLFLAYTNS